MKFKGIRRRKAGKSSGLTTAIVCLLLLGIGYLVFTVIHGSKGSSKTDNTQTAVNSTDCEPAVTPAADNTSGEIKDFPTLCDVPAGWTVIKDGEAKDSLGVYAYIKRMYEIAGVRYIEIDPVEWYEGDEANKQMKKDDPTCEKTLGPGCPVPEGFYVRNKDKTVARYQVGSNLSVTMQTLDKDANGQFKFEEKITADRLFKVFSTPTSEEMHFAETPFVLDIRQGKVTRVLEQYIP